MLIDCEVWKQDCNEIVRVGGFGYNKMYTQRTIVDTDLFNWWNEVTFIKSDYGYPYPNQCMIPYKEKGKYPLIVSKDVLLKIREKLGKNIITI